MLGRMIGGGGYQSARDGMPSSLGSAINPQQMPGAMQPQMPQRPMGGLFGAMQGGQGMGNPMGGMTGGMLGQGGPGNIAMWLDKLLGNGGIRG